jgi:hypothetical protein
MRNHRCEVWGLACSTAYVKRGCHCNDCQEWQSERLARGREGGPRAPRTRTRSAGTPEPVLTMERPPVLRRVPMPSEFGLSPGRFRQRRAVAGGRPSTGGIFVRLSCGHEVSAESGPLLFGVGAVLRCPRGAPELDRFDSAGLPALPPPADSLPS